MSRRERAALVLSRCGHGVALALISKNFENFFDWAWFCDQNRRL